LNPRIDPCFVRGSPALPIALCKAGVHLVSTGRLWQSNGMTIAKTVLLLVLSNVFMT
jgi:hypothetical protein